MHRIPTIPFPGGLDQAASSLIVLVAGEKGAIPNITRRDGQAVESDRLRQPGVERIPVGPSIRCFVERTILASGEYGFRIAGRACFIVGGRNSDTIESGRAYDKAWLPIPARIGGFEHTSRSSNGEDRSTGNGKLLRNGFPRDCGDILPGHILTVELIHSSARAAAKDRIGGDSQRPY